MGKGPGRTGRARSTTSSTPPSHSGDKPVSVVDPPELSEAGGDRNSRKTKRDKVQEEPGRSRSVAPALSLRDRIELRLPLTYAEAAEYCHRSTGSLRNEVHAGRLQPTGRSGRLLLFDLDDLDRLMRVGSDAPAGSTCRPGR